MSEKSKLLTKASVLKDQVDFGEHLHNTIKFAMCAVSSGSAVAIHQYCLTLDNQGASDKLDIICNHIYYIIIMS